MTGSRSDVTDEPVTTSEPLIETPTRSELDGLLDELYHGQERLSQAEIQRRAVAAELPAEILIKVSALPEGEYALDEVADLLGATPG
ncbi:hypothetical protein [Micromonospora sp. SH-82]|uniref:hypothetical protein n=1 Tax=Micromonospora sp. SH-82 TaxID=3132938 RepID=UPI003EC0D08B